MKWTPTTNEKLRGQNLMKMLSQILRAKNYAKIKKIMLHSKPRLKTTPREKHGLIYHMKLHHLNHGTMYHFSHIYSLYFKTSCLKALDLKHDSLGITSYPIEMHNFLTSFQQSEIELMYCDYMLTQVRKCFLSVQLASDS